MKRNLKKIITERNINPYYDLNAKEAIEIYQTCDKEPMQCVMYGFLYGYEMGKRATLAELKKKR